VRLEPVRSSRSRTSADSEYINSDASPVRNLTTRSLSLVGVRPDTERALGRYTVRSLVSLPPVPRDRKTQSSRNFGTQADENCAIESLLAGFLIRNPADEQLAIDSNLGYSMKTRHVS